MLEKSNAIVLEALAQGLFSGAQLSVSDNNGRIFGAAYGSSSFSAEAILLEDNSLFDLASLTKPLATATACAVLAAAGEIDLNAPLGKFIPQYKGDGKETVTLKMLLNHTSGLPAWKPYYERLTGMGRGTARERLLELLMEEPLENLPETVETYSDLGFMLLSFVIEKVAGTRLDAFVEEKIYSRLAISDLFFLPMTCSGNSQKLAGRTLVTSRPQDGTGCILVPVNDDNAAAVGGICGHAGLFGTVEAVESMLWEWRHGLAGQSELLPRDTVIDFWHPFHKLPRSGHVLGWDRPIWKVSHAGRYISPHAIGHLGFTGTSCWIDPDHELSVVFLTNRTAGTCSLYEMAALRRRLHECIFEECGAVSRGPYKRIAADAAKHIHLSAVAGTAMGSLAGLLKEAGFQVSGSDEQVYPPMSDQLAEQGIAVHTPFAAENLNPPPDAVVIGNVCSRNHPEAVETQRRGLPYESLPSAIERFFLNDRLSLVVAGTHGKTTTSSLLAWLLEATGRDPGFMIGGVLSNFGRSFKLGTGHDFVLEGDEYDSAYFDKAPKFLHYRPHGAIITSIEFDHADIYDSVDEIEERFAEFAALIPSDGVLVAYFENDRVRRAAGKAVCRVLSYGLKSDYDWHPAQIKMSPEGTTFALMNRGREIVRLKTAMSGEHNILNITAACALLVERGLDPALLPVSLESFKGVARRQNVYGPIAGVRVIDDFAHHPTAIRYTLEGLRRAYPEGRMLTAFDPATNTTSRNFFQKELAECFACADVVVFGPPSRSDRIVPSERLDLGRLTEDLQQNGIAAYHGKDADEIAALLLHEARAGDNIVVMSNRSFGGLKNKLIELLGKR